MKATALTTVTSQLVVFLNQVIPSSVPPKLIKVIHHELLIVCFDHLSLHARS